NASRKRLRHSTTLPARGTHEGRGLAMLTISVEGSSGGGVLSRRALLRTSLLGAGALGLPTLLRQRATAGAPRRDTAVLQLWPGGGPSHPVVYVPKPAAPPD